MPRGFSFARRFDVYPLDRLPCYVKSTSGFDIRRAQNAQRKFTEAV